MLNEALVLESGLDVKHAVLNKYIFVRDGGFLELTVTEATYFSTFGPDLVIEAARKIVRVNGAVCMCDDGAEAVPNQEASETESDEQPN